MLATNSRQHAGKHLESFPQFYATTVKSITSGLILSDRGQSDRAGGRVGFLNPTGLFRGRGYRCGLYTLREQVVPRGGGCGRQIESQYKLLRNFPGVPVGKAVLPLQGMPVYPWLGNQDHARCAVWSKINKQIIIIIIIKQHLPMDRLPQV